MEALAKPGKILPISLGYNCHQKVCIDMLGELTEQGYARQPFDWIGTPMWAIVDILENDFQDLNTRELLVLRKRFVDDDTEYLTNTKYNVVFLHDYGKDLKAISPETYTKVEEDYKRRVARFKTSLTLPYHILFLRQETNRRPRIQYPGMEGKDPDELTYVKRFATLMKQKNVDFTVVYLTTTHSTNFDADHRICCVQFENPEQKILSGVDIYKVLEKNLSFITKCLPDFKKKSKPTV